MMLIEMERAIQEIETEIVDEFALFDEWTDKYQYIIDLGKSLPVIDDAYKTDEYKVKGCQSSVWLHASMGDGRVLYKADSDAVIVKGLVSLLIKVLSGQKPDDILEAELKFIDQIGMHEHLSPTRSNGLVALIRQMKYYALALKVKEG